MRVHAVGTTVGIGRSDTSWIHPKSLPDYSVLHKYLQVMVSTKLFVHVSVGPKGSNSVRFVTQDPRESRCSHKQSLTNKILKTLHLNLFMQNPVLSCLIALPFEYMYLVDIRAHY